ncbi:MAG: hypothetical protein AAB597_01685 [Patescibacteria group bacterium]
MSFLKEKIFQGRTFRVKTKLAFVLALISGFFAILFYLNISTENPATPIVGGSYAAKVAEWKDFFRRSGSAKGYAHFASVAEKLPYNDAHELAHIIGEILEKREGDSGIGFCTNVAAFGCYHGFSGASLYRNGLAAVAGLSQGCSSVSGLGGRMGCMHGVGHGILAHLGDESLEQALLACAPFQGDSKTGGCYGGVFMEYNYRTMQSSTGIDLRPYNPNQPYTPCEEIKETFKEACYYEIPAWWRASLEKDGDVKTELREVGRLCGEAGDAGLKAVCFRGVGNMIGPRSEYNYSRMREWCSFMPTEGRESCFREALNHLLQSEAGKEELRLRCVSGEIRYEDFCRNPEETSASPATISL